MKRAFSLTPEARGDLQEILFDIAEDSPDSALRVRIELYENLKKLALSPGIGHSVTNSSAGNIGSGISTRT